ncbi:DUF5361 domain-containing protein [Erysipelothrix sp. D19-032]
MRLVASFANGLRDGSRIRMIMSGSNVSTETLLLASIFDKLNILIWQNTKDGRKGANKPVSLAKQNLSRLKQREIRSPPGRILRKEEMNY